MELRDCIVAVLHRHRIIRMSKGCQCLIDLVERYLTDFEDMLLSGLLREVAQGHGVEPAALYTLLRGLAQRIGRRDPQWFCETFPEGYSTSAFLQTIAREVRLFRGTPGP